MASQEANSWKWKRPANGPTGSNTCLSTAIYGSWSSVHLPRHRKFLCADFSESKLPTQTGIPCGNVRFLTLRGVRCKEACSMQPTCGRRAVRPTERTLKNKRSGAIGVAGVAHGKSRTRLRKRIRRMKPAGESTRGQYGGQAMRPTERTLKNKRSRAICVAGVAHGKSRRSSGGSFAKELGE